MKKTKLSKIMSLLLCALMLAAALLVTSGCDKKETGGESFISSTASTEVIELGMGEKQFSFTVTFVDGSTKAYKISTDKNTVGEALFELGLIDGEEDIYGLYVKSVCGVTLDYDKDKKYWAFYENGGYASKGVELTDIESGVIYEFRAK